MNPMTDPLTTPSLRPWVSSRCTPRRSPPRWRGSSPRTYNIAPFAQAEPASTATWILFNGEKQIMAAPRIGMVRALMFNHWYHHRGQILVYLRMLDISVPSVYGPTADENPFAA